MSPLSGPLIGPFHDRSEALAGVRLAGNALVSGTRQWRLRADFAIGLNHVMSFRSESVNSLCTVSPLLLCFRIRATLAELPTHARATLSGA